ncbi:hypothetical protein GONAM_11_00100 [Gordonia namibiensis NBRC 108229]|uniref:Uncharacterized protein n=1 Tax=Gordonia namibiensis NBRC 108229 TaxID=1208314 RepID=K6WKG0_9ACTN|nr:hypothetical protein [Gordonia namibiensis]GAB99830.1 hypothetical protein GONAM_11_00100 [Gordonia namibiensis NBRC 108229]
MIGDRARHRDAERGAVVNAFGIGSRPLWVTMGAFGCGYLAVTVYANADVTGVWQWVGIIAGFLFFAAGAFLILDAPGDPLPVPTTVLIAVLAVAGVTASLFSLPFPLTHVMQTGPSIGASVIVLAFVAVRGRPLAAWSASIVISLVATEWGHVAIGDAMWGLAVTLPGYAIMIMGSLFSLMLRPMARQLYGLREANERQAARDAAAAAAAEVRSRRLAALDERARPILTRIAERQEFSAEEVAVARLIEAQLRDGIRASDLDMPEVRDAAWRARQRGVKVVLLDDGGLSVLAEEEAARTRDRLGAAVAELLADAESGRVTVRIHPPGRNTLASVGVDTDDQVELVEFTTAGAALQEASADRRLSR